MILTTFHASMLATTAGLSCLRQPTALSTVVWPAERLTFSRGKLQARDGLKLVWQLSCL